MSKLNLDGQEALNEIKSLILEVANLKKALKNITTSGVTNFDKLENNFTNLKDKVGLLTNKLNYLEVVIKKNTTLTSQNTTAVNNNTTKRKSNTDSLDKQTKATNKSNKSTKTNTVETKKSTSAFKSLNISIKSVLASFGILSGIQILKDIIKDVFETTKTFDSLDFALEKITGSNFAAADSQRFLLDITERFGVELITTTNRWIKFLAAAKNAGLRLKETEDIFRSVTKASGVLGLKTDELTGVYLALEQMLSKGKVTTEELRRQLGERLPGAMGIMAAAIGVTIPKLDEMLKKGEVLSADALPKFAEALEIAYDIKHVETINTLVAEQNRLSKAWQLFIKNITEGDSKLRSTFGFLLKVLKESVEYIDILFESDAQSLQRAIEASTIYLKSELEQDAENDLFFRGFELREKIEKDKIALAENTKKELQSILEQELANSITQLQEHEKQKEEIIKKVAENEIDLALEEFKKQEIIYKDFLDKKLKLDESFAKERGIFNKKFTEERLKEAFGENTNLKNETDFKDLFAKIEDDLADATAKWVLFKKLIQESNVVVPDDEEVKKTQRNLRAIKDLYLEIQNEILKFGVEGNKRILDNEKSSIAERKKALLEIYQAETSIAENQNLIRIRDIESKFKREDEALKKSLENGRLSRIKYNQFILDLEKEKNQKIELVMIALSDRLLKIQDKNFKLNLEIEVDEEAIIVDKIEDDYNRRIIAIKKEFNALDTTTERKKELEVELRNLSIQMANEIIDAKIAILKSNLKLFENEEEYTEQILRDINDLEAAKKSLAEPPETARDWIAFWQEVLGFASDLLSSIGDITDGIFGNRIENIEAEIEAERNKYDTLIDLARGEELEQQQLRLEKEARIKELEKKRLKEEQKQARAKKAFAIADIGIKTAQAIIGIWADVPKVDFGISAGLLTTFVSALGAAQIGAVLATPIPKYKEGSKGIKREHIGMINDGLHKEYIERKGNILTTDRKNAIVNLLPGDVIYKSYDEMKRKSSHIDAMSNYNRNNNRQNNAFIYGIKSEIKNGFKNIKINNEIKNVIDSDNARYADSMTRWN